MAAVYCSTMAKGEQLWAAKKKIPKSNASFIESTVKIRATEGQLITSSRKIRDSVLFFKDRIRN